MIQIPADFPLSQLISDYYLIALPIITIAVLFAAGRHAKKGIKATK